jgi:hypothetical protein
MDDKAAKDLANQSKFFNISSYSRGKVAAKRKKKGLGELKPRESNPYVMVATYGTSICLAKTVFAPLERLRILS